MPRKPRLEAGGLIHHACLNGVNGEFIFRNDEDRVGYLLMLAAAVQRHGWRCLSYCLMGTHVHLLIETPEPNFGRGMQWLNSRYAIRANKQYGRDGHLYKGRYHDEPVLTDAHLLMVVPYIAVNPVEAGLCRDPKDWRWSSHHRVVRGIRPAWLAHEHLLDRLEAITGSRASYDRLIDARLRAY
jgi:REP element-mobilizing transposase RayT